MYTLQIWRTERTPIPEIRHNVSRGLAYAIAVNAGWYKTQVICPDMDTIEFEVKHDGLRKIPSI